MIKVYATSNYKSYELLNALDEKGITYETVQPTTEWVVMNKIRELPVIEVDGKLLDYRKSVKYIKKIRG